MTGWGPTLLCTLPGKYSVVTLIEHIISKEVYLAHFSILYHRTNEVLLGVVNILYYGAAYLGSFCELGCIPD